MKGSIDMAIHKFIEEIGEKVIPPRVAKHSLAAKSESIRRHLLSSPGYTAPSDLVVIFDETDAVAIIGGTVRDECTRALIIEAAGNIQGVEKVDDRMVSTG
jgi:hypothetical protein